MKQKLGIAAAVMGSPQIVILDEPINAIDESGVKKVRKILSGIKAKGSLIIIACHDRTELEQLSDTIITIENGRITNNGKKIQKKLHKEYQYITNQKNQ